MAKNEVAKVDEGGVPAYLKNYEGEAKGLRSMDSTDIVIPRIKLLQATSDEVTMYDAAKAGTFWHNMADVVIGDSFDFIVALDAKRYLLVPPIGDPRGVLARCDDCVHWNPPDAEFEIRLKGVKNPVVWRTRPTLAESRLAEWGTSNPDDPDSPPAATLFYQYLVILPDFPELSPVMLSLTRSQISPAKKQLNSKIQMHADIGRPMQAIKFRAVVKPDQSDEGSFWNYQFQSAGFATEEQFNTATKYADRYSKQGFVAADEAGAAAEGTRATDDADPGTTEY